MSDEHLDPVAVAVARAESLTALGRHEDCLRVLAPVLASDPANVAAHLVASSAGLALRDGETARRHAVAAMRLAPDDVRCHVAVSLAFTLEGNRGAAARAAEDAVRIDPSHRQAHVALAVAGLNDRRAVERTRRAARRALDLTPDDPMMHVVVAQAHMYNGRAFGRRRDRRVALRHLEQALALAPDSPQANTHLAVLEAMGWRPAASTRRHATVLASAPHTRASAHGVDFALTRMTVLLQVLASGAWVALLAVRGPGDHRTTAGAVVGAAAALALVAVTTRTLVGLGRAAAPALRSWARGYRQDAVWLGELCCVLGGVALAGLTTDAGTAAVAFALAGGGLFVGLCLMVVRPGREGTG